MLNDTLYFQKRTRTFAEIMADPQDPNPEAEGKTGYTYFAWWIGHCGIPQRLLVDEQGSTDYANYSLQTIYYLLMSRYANSHIKSSDEARFKLDMASIIFQHGAEWQRICVLQDKLHRVTDTELLKGSTVIHNFADHPDINPGTQATEELSYISNQNTTLYKKNKVDGYTQIMPWLELDITNKFLNYFKHLFGIFSVDFAPLLYRQD